MKKLYALLIAIKLTLSTQLMGMQQNSIIFTDGELYILSLPHKKTVYTISDILSPKTGINKKLHAFDAMQIEHFKKSGLIFAASRNWSAIVKSLLFMKYDPNEQAQDNYGARPLTEACYWGRLDIVITLLAWGADPTLTSSDVTQETHPRCYTPLESTKARNKFSWSIKEKDGPYIITLLSWWLDIWNNTDELNHTDAQERITRYQDWLKENNNIELLKFWLQYFNEDYTPISYLIDWWQTIVTSPERVNTLSFILWIHQPNNLQRLVTWLMTEDHRQEDYPIPCHKYNETWEAITLQAPIFY